MADPTMPASASTGFAALRAQALGELQGRGQAPVVTGPDTGSLPPTDNLPKVILPPPEAPAAAAEPADSDNLIGQANTELTAMLSKLGITPGNPNIVPESPAAGAGDSQATSPTGGMDMSNWKQPPQGLAPLFAAQDQKYNMPAGLLQRMGFQESHWLPDVINGSKTSTKGAQGIMQFEPGTVADWKNNKNVVFDPLKPEEAIPVAAQQLHDNYKEFGNWLQAVAAYNWNPKGVKAAIEKARNGGNWLDYIPAETHKYLMQVGADVPMNRS